MFCLEESSKVTVFSRIRFIALGFILVMAGFVPANFAQASPAVQPAADPLDVSSSQIYDPDNKLGDDGIYQVKSSIEAAKNFNMSVYIAIVPDFGELSPREWNEKTMQLSHLQANSYLLSIAYNPNADGAGEIAASSTAGSAINSAQTGDRAMQVLPYQLSNGDYASGVSSFVQQLMDLAMSAKSGPAAPADNADVSGRSTNNWFILMLILAMFVAVALAIAIYRRNSYSTAAKTQDSAKFDGVEKVNQDNAVESNATFTPATATDTVPPENATQPVTTFDTPVAVGDTPEATPTDTYVAAAPTAAPPEQIQSEAPTYPEPEMLFDEAAAAESEASYERGLNAVHDLNKAIFAAAEDLHASVEAFGPAETNNFAATLDFSREQANALMNWLAGADLVSSEEAGQVEDSAQQVKQVLSAEVLEFTKRRHNPEQVEVSLNRLAAAWNRARKSLAQVEIVEKQLETDYPRANLGHARANLSQSKRLLKAAYKGILSGQKCLQGGDAKTAIRYARGSERAITQTEFALEHITKLGAFLSETKEHLSNMLETLNANVQTVRTYDPEASGQEIAITLRTMEKAQKALVGEGDPIEALSKLCGLQANLFNIYGTSVLAQDLTQLQGQFPLRLEWEQQHLELLRTDIMLRRNSIDPQIELELARCEQLIAQAREKLPQGPLIGMTMLSTSAEMLIQLGSGIPEAFPTPAK